jgi:hypothetical protein
MTAVLRRPQWKYNSSHVYRAVLIEAGHLCQTFCFVATWLGLAPFCSMALANSRIESDIGIDGVSESVLYAAGAGTPPGRPKWAPWPTRFPGARYQNPSFAQYCLRFKVRLPRIGDKAQDVNSCSAGKFAASFPVDAEGVAIEIRRPRHPHPEAGESGVREVVSWLSAVAIHLRVNGRQNTRRARTAPAGH